VREWIDAHAARTGEVEVMLQRQWSTVARVPTAEGDLWFKEVPAHLGFEPALTAALAERHPAHVPEVVAAAGPRLLTRDAGRRLRNVHDEGAAGPAWEEMLPLYAELQVELVAEVEAALALGVPDRRPQRLLEAALPGWDGTGDAIGEAVAALGDSVPATVVHEEATDGNVFVRDGHIRFVDWGEASVAHPFTGALLPLRVAVERGGDAERLRDLYLEQFTRYAPLPELREQFGHAYLLATVVRAIGWHETLEHEPPEAVAKLGDPVAGWREVFDGIRDGTITLGEA
jgi:hypothetical protein